METTGRSYPQGYQKGPTKPENQRSISLLPGFSKITQWLLKEEVSTFMEDTNLIQFGFQRCLVAIQQAANLVVISQEDGDPRKMTVAALLDVGNAY